MLWNRFWFAEGNPLSLGVFRALFAVCLAWELPFTRGISLFAIEGGFHLPYLPFIGPISPYLYLGIHDLQWVFIALLGLGVMTRASAAALLVLQGYVFFADQLNFRNHPYFFLLVLLLLACSPAGRSFSLPALLRRIRARRGDAAVSMAPLTVQRLIQVQVSIVYFYAALHKLTGPYLSGQVLSGIMAPALATGRVSRMLGMIPHGAAEMVRAMLANPQFWVVAACITVFLELSLPFALWIPKIRKPAMIFGVCFHLGIAVMMTIDTFSAAMIASYLLFLDPETLPRVFAGVRNRLGGPARVGPNRPSVPTTR